MTNKQYSIALTVTYVPYIVAELPSNLLLRVRFLCLYFVSLSVSSYAHIYSHQVVGPDRMLPTMITLWGLVTALQGTLLSCLDGSQISIYPSYEGITKTYGGLLACRFFLGLLEGKHRTSLFDM